MQGTRARSLVWEDTTCHRATKPPCITITKACMPRACAPQQERPPQQEAWPLQRRVAPTHRNERKPVHSNEGQCSQKEKEKRKKVHVQGAAIQKRKPLKFRGSTGRCIHGSLDYSAVVNFSLFNPTSPTFTRIFSA